MSRIRFGVRISSWFFKNAGVFVFYASEKQAQQLAEAVLALRLILGEISPDIANKLVFEVE